MRARWSVIAVMATILMGCGTEQPEPQGAARTPEFRLTASIQDIMLSIVDPAADAIWESVATIVTHEGTEERRPRTDEEWLALRHQAIRLVESANLLLMHGRDVARPGFESENPGIELEPEEIQELLDEDPDTWNRHVGDFYRVASTMLEAIETRDADRLFDEGGPLDVTCERCHQEYWYPDEPTLQGRADPPPRPAPIAAGSADAVAEEPTGRIEGHVRLAGDLPGNPVIRMGVDPRCAEVTQGKQMVQETVLTAPDGSLANVFVQLRGTFPETPVPEEPVEIDQRDCIFVPRVVGAQVGQLVRISNSDPLLHNLNTATGTANDFNVAQPMQGMVHEFQAAPEEGMLRIRCDLHRWMTEYIGIVPHPYFAVTDLTGTFVMTDVPVGTHTIEIWHEEFGVLTETVTVTEDSVAVADFTYPAADE